MRDVKMKMYYIAADRGALSYWRCVLPGYYLNRKGLAEVAIDFGRFLKEYVDWADLVVVQRVLGQSIKHLIEYCHMTKKKVVYDLDDNLFNMPDSPEYRIEGAEMIPIQAKEIMLMCDAVSVSTEGIYEAIVEECIEVRRFILLNYFDFTQWAKLNIQHDHFLVGWAGGHYHVQDLDMVVPGLKQIINGNKHVTLVFIGACPMSLILEHPNRVFLQEFVPVEVFPKTMAAMRFDIGLAPLFPTEFAKSRSNIRLLQYSALEIPSVCSYWGEYARMVDDGFPCMVVNNDNWADCIQELIDNKEKRQYIGKEAYKFVTERFDINKNIQVWANAYEEVLNS